ncbi:hypothetical protein ACVT98_09565 [Vibrio campbellii]
MPRIFGTAHSTILGGAIYEESLVQVDKRIVTAMPNGYVDFGLAVAEALELLDCKQKQFILSYHKQGAH